MSEMEVDPHEREVEVPSPSLSLDDNKKDLASAVAAGDKEAVVKALEEREDVLIVVSEYREYHSVNLLCIAAREGKAEVIVPLYSAGAQINHVTKNGFSALHIAAQYGYTQVLNKLVELKINVNATAERGFNALHTAAQYGQPHILEELVKGGLNVNTFTKHGLNAMHIAAQYGHSQVLSKLVPLGINVNAKSSHGLNALHIAAQNGRPQVLSMLVNHGIDVNATTERGFNALHLSVQHGHPQVASALVRLGIGVNSANAHGLKVVHLAARYGHSQVLNELSSLGMDVHAMTSRGFNAVHIAAQNNQPQVLSNLVHLGMDVNNATRYGRWTALHCAADSGNCRCVEELLKLGANKDALDNRQWTPLMVAEKKKQVECVRILKSEGARILNDNATSSTNDGATSSPIDTYLVVKSVSANNKGPLYVFNYIDFIDASSKRVGAESDSQSISDTFTSLGYDVHICTNYAYQKTLDKFEELQRDQTLNSLVIIILSHGDGRLTFKTSDDKNIDLGQLRQKFLDSACPTLKGRSKIFLANFCRGQFIEYNNDVEYDYDANAFSPGQPKLEAPHNMVTIHAATEGIMAARDTIKGTIFIQCLCKIINENPTMELKSILNELCRQMKKKGGTTPMQETFPPIEDFKF